MTHAFFLEPAEKAIRDAVAKVASRTSAEVVVTIRRASGDYRLADAQVGLVFATILLAVFLYYPEPFDYTFLPLELGAAYVLGSILAANVAPIRRVFSSRRLRDENAARAAKAAFVDLGVARSEARTGVLVFVAAFEQRVEVVPDIGIDPEALGPGWEEAKRKLDRAFRLDASVELFVAAVEELGAVLTQHFPHPDAAPDSDRVPESDSDADADP